MKEGGESARQEDVRRPLVGRRREHGGAARLGDGLLKTRHVTDTLQEIKYVDIGLQQCKLLLFARLA